MELSTNLNLPNEMQVPPEREMKIYEKIYHGQKIKIVELEHGTIDHTQNISTDFIRPKKWKEELTTQLMQNTDSLIFPEYCLPDLYKRAFSELGTREIVVKLFEETGTTEFYSHISKFAGIQGVPLFAADIANTNIYEIYNHPFIYLNSNLTLSADKIQEFEKSGFSNIYDARHLILARGIMQEILRLNQPIIHINAPFHALRIDNYVKEQIDWENESGIKIKEPVDFKYVSPEEAIKKMGKYGKYFGLDITVRKYTPILPPVAYEIDMLANNLETENSNSKLEAKLNEYLTFGNQKGQEKVVYQRIKEFSEVLKSDNPQKVSDSAKRILTDESGWRLSSVNRIY